MKNSNSAVATKSTAVAVKDLLEKNKHEIRMILPKHVPVDRFFRMAIGALARNDQLAKCTPRSVFLGIVQAATLGLDVSGMTGEAYLVPYWNKDLRGFEAQFMPGYVGLIALARRTGDVKAFYAERVCENDIFEQERGLEPKLYHKINVGDRGKTVGFYAVYKTADGEADFEWLTMEDTLKIKASSMKKVKDPNNPNLPWNAWFEEMGKKTAIRRLGKRAPRSIELNMAMEADKDAAIGSRPDYSIIQDHTGIHVEDDGPISPMELGDGDEDIPDFPVEEEELVHAG